MENKTVIFSVHTLDGDCGNDEGEVGEAQGFMDSQGQVIGFWAMNDANWRSEYFNDTFAKLGIDIQRGSLEQNRAFVTHLLDIGYG